MAARPAASGRTPDILEPLRHSSLSVVVPVFNEACAIVDNLQLLVSEVEPYFSNYEILVISDGSTDGTDKALATMTHPRVRTLAYPKNRGKGYAVRQGFQATHGDYVLFIDGGMELHPREIRTFLGLMALYDADIVVGSKRHPQSEVTYPWLRRALSGTYQALVRALFDLDVTDTQVGLKLFRRQVLDSILPDLTLDRYGFDLELLALAKRRGFTRMLEAPIRLDYFGKNIRSLWRELFHVGHIGSVILRDTWVIYRRLRAERR